MRIGIMTGAGEGPEGTIDGMVKRALEIEGRGFHSLWMANIMGPDAITTQAIVGRETSRIELGTAVVPSYPRHPFAMAQQCLTAQAAADGRFVLGVGLSHKIVIEDMLGLSFEKPARHMRQYMAVLGPLLRGEPVQYAGSEYRVTGALQVQGGTPVPVVIAALGERMLQIAGETADGTLTWMTGPKTLEDFVGPRIRSAAKAAGRPEPRIIAGLPIALTNDPDRAREKLAQDLVIYGQLPSYRGMLDREGLAGPADIAILGDEKELDQALDRLRDVGVTDLDAAVFPTDEGADKRTLDYLQSRL